MVRQRLPNREGLVALLGFNLPGQTIGPDHAQFVGSAGDLFVFVVGFAPAFAVCPTGGGGSMIYIAAFHKKFPTLRLPMIIEVAQLLF